MIRDGKRANLAKLSQAEIPRNVSANGEQGNGSSVLALFHRWLGRINPGFGTYGRAPGSNPHGRIKRPIRTVGRLDWSALGSSRVALLLDKWDSGTDPLPCSLCGVQIGKHLKNSRFPPPARHFHKPHITPIM